MQTTSSRETVTATPFDGQWPGSDDALPGVSDRETDRQAQLWPAIVVCLALTLAALAIGSITVWLWFDAILRAASGQP